MIEVSIYYIFADFAIFHYPSVKFRSIETSSRAKRYTFFIKLGVDDFCDEYISPQNLIKIFNLEVDEIIIKNLVGRNAHIY